MNDHQWCTFVLLFTTAYLAFSNRSQGAPINSSKSWPAGIAILSNQQISNKLESYGYPSSGLTLMHVCRSQTGDKVSLIAYSTNIQNRLYDRPEFLVIASNAVKHFEMPSTLDMYRLNGDGPLIAWFTVEPDVWHFASGYSIYYNTNGVFDFVKNSLDGSSGSLAKTNDGPKIDIDPGGTFFIAQTWLSSGPEYGKIYLGRVANPPAMRCVATNFFYLHATVFYESGHIYICGAKGRHGEGARCLVLHEVPGGYAQDENLDFPDLYGIWDVDASGAFILGNDIRAASALLYVENIMTRQKKIVGRECDNAFFLQKELIDSLYKN